MDKALGLLVHKEWDEEKRARLRQIVLSFFSDVRDRMEMREELLAPREKGGMAVDAEEATYMVGVLAAMRDGGPLPVRPASKIAVMTQPSVTTAPPAAPALPAAAPQPKPAPAPVARAEFAGKRREEIFAVLAKEIVEEVQPKLADAALRPRLEALIATRFRGVRDANEIRAHMKRDAAQGGLSMAPEEIERVMSVAEDRFAKISKELLSQEKGRVLEGIKQESAAGRSQKQGTSNDIKEYEVNQWYEKRFERQPQAPAAPAPKATPKPTPPPSPPVQGGGKPAMPPPEVAPAAPAAPAPRPTMQDAEYRPRLMGPVEELRSMTLDDFRRLARDPKEAARRIQDKIRLLEEEDYTQRAAAIGAWRGSVPVKTYLSITRTMFDQGIGPEQAVAAQGKGPDALTLEEYNAIMELQNSLRY